MLRQLSSISERPETAPVDRPVERQKLAAGFSAFGAAATPSAMRACPETCLAVLKRDIWKLALLALFLAPALSDCVHADGCVPAERLIRIVAEREGDGTHFYVENLQAADVTMTLEVRAVNLNSTVSFPHTATYAGRRRVKAFSLTPGEQEKGWNWEYTYYATYGNMSAVHDDTYVYSLPYAAGKTYRVSQAFNGMYSHFGPNQFAIDWKMPVGTPIHAARDGIVVGAKDDSDMGGGDSKYDSHANYIMIQHADGTIGHYVHLRKSGNKVKIGQRVRAGEAIGLSGNTGHSTGPHLHFAVFKARDGKLRQTVPVTFRTSSAATVTLQEGKNYTATEIFKNYGLLTENDATAVSLAENKVN